MSDVDRLLDQIEEDIVDHGGDLAGWTLRGDGTLQLFDGRLTLRAELKDTQDPHVGRVHAHVYATLHDYHEEVLDACVLGVQEEREKALSEASNIWVGCVAVPIKSFLDGPSVPMTCKTGIEAEAVSEGDSPGDYGLPGLQAYVGPPLSRGFGSQDFLPLLNGTKPWFRYAAESAAPRRVHLAKATILHTMESGWSRELEVDGHDVSYRESDWPAGIEGAEVGWLVRYAVFEFPRNSPEIARRAELERGIRYFAKHFAESESVDRLMEEMVGNGFAPSLVHDIEMISTLAFGRAVFEKLGVQYPSTIIRARCDGRVETDVPLMSIPAYSRARALAPHLREAMSDSEYQSLSLYSPESGTIMQALESGGADLDLSQATMFPSVIPDRGVSDETMNAAMAELHKVMASDRPPRQEPWWKFWRR